MTNLAKLGAIFLVIWSFLSCNAAYPQAASEPWKEPQDTVSALFTPDAYAWRLFIALNWPADISKQEADPLKALGSPGPVVWETWRNVRNESQNPVYRPDGGDPGEWLVPALVARNFNEFDPEPRKVQMIGGLATIRRGVNSETAFDLGSTGSEVRLNKSGYEFVRSNQLYNLEGQLAAVGTGATSLDFPANAKEIKAAWKPIREEDKSRFHWTEVTIGDSKQIWGLVALHILTKDIPNWFWATFEHIDNKSDGPGWQLASVDHAACPQTPHDCELAPTGLGLEGTVWSNYRLRGSQIDFINVFGTPTRVANSLLEADQARSSCITCHSLATLDSEGNSTSFAFIVGPPQPAWFTPTTPNTKVMKLDFVFSLQRARPKQQ